MPNFGAPLASPTFVTSGWGADRGYRGGKHEGVDFRAKIGTPTYSIGRGIVTRVDKTADSAAGKWIGIDHGHGWFSRYMHMSRIYVEKGQQVARGELIGKTGNTGDPIIASGPHLHFDLHYFDKPIPAEPYIPVDEYAPVVIANARRRNIPLYAAGGAAAALVAATLIWALV